MASDCKWKKIEFKNLNLKVQKGLHLDLKVIYTILTLKPLYNGCSALSLLWYLNIKAKFMSTKGLHWVPRLYAPQLNGASILKAAERPESRPIMDAPKLDQRTRVTNSRIPKLKNYQQFMINNE